MPSYTQYMRQMAVMDADDDIESWITVKGNHIPIKKGQSKEDAVKSFIEKKGGSGEKKPEKSKALGIAERSAKYWKKQDPKGMVGIYAREMGETAKELRKIEGKDPNSPEYQEALARAKRQSKAWRDEEKMNKGLGMTGIMARERKDIYNELKKTEKKKDSVKDILTTYAQRMSNAGIDAPLSKIDRIEADAIKEFMKRKVGEGKKYNDYYEYWLNGMSEKDRKDFNQIYHESEAREMAFRELSGLPTYINYNESNIELAPKENESDLKKWDAEVTKYHDEEEKVEQQRKAIQSDLSKFSDVYNKLYKDSNAFAYNPKNLDAEFKKAGENSETFKEWVRSMAKERQDGFTSDRELRALLIVAKEKGLIPEKKTTSRKPDNHVYVDTKHPNVHYVDPKAWAAPANDPFSAYYD